MVGQDERIITIDTLGPHRLLRCLIQSRSGRLWEAERINPDGDPIRSLIIVLEAEDDQAFRERVVTIDRLGPHGWASPRVVARDTGGRRQVVFELNDDVLLDEWAGGPRNEADRLRLALTLADGVDRAHEAGISHGRLSPSCVAVGADGPRLIDLPLGPPASPDAVRDDRWTGPWERRDEGGVLGDRRRLAAGMYWLLTGRPARDDRDHQATLVRGGCSDAFAGMIARGFDPAAEPASAAALVRRIGAELAPAPPEKAEGSTPSRLRGAGLAAAIACVGVLGFVAGQSGKSKIADSYERAAIAYEAAAVEKDALIDELEQREALRRRAIGSVQDTLAYREYGAGITPNTLHLLGLIEMLTWPLDGSEESVNGRAKLHAERMKVARTLVDRAHIAADAEHIEVMLTELALGSWLFQSGKHAEAAVVLGGVSGRLQDRLQPSDPMRRGAEQLLQLAVDTALKDDPRFAAGLEPWVARILANPLDADSSRDAFEDFASISVAIRGEASQALAREDFEFTMRMQQRLIDKKLLNPAQ